MGLALCLLLIQKPLHAEPAKNFTCLAALALTSPSDGPPPEALIQKIYFELLDTLGARLSVETVKQLAESKTPFTIPEQVGTELAGLQKRMTEFERMLSDHGWKTLPVEHQILAELARRVAAVPAIAQKREAAVVKNGKHHAGDLDLRHLTSAEGLTLPSSVGGNLYLSHLTSAKGLTLPHSVGGALYLSRLTSAEGLTLPHSVGGNLDLSGLTSAEGLILPKKLGGKLILAPKKN